MALFFLRIPYVVCLLALAATAGCVVRKVDPNPKPSAVLPSEFRHASPPYPAESAQGSDARTDWWMAFADPLLDELVDEALTRNTSILEAVARLEQADAVLRQSQSQLFPSITGSGDLNARWIEEMGESRVNAAPDVDSKDEQPIKTGSFGSLLRWELDVWGRLRHQKRANKAEREAARLDIQSVRLLVSTAVAQTYFEIREKHSQLRLLEDQIQVNRTLLDLTRLRFGQGLSSIVDVLQQQEQLAATQARVPEVESDFVQLAYALDVLMGATPGVEVRDYPTDLYPPPANGFESNPEILLNTRPDLLALRERLVAADNRVGTAMADRLPRFVIGGQFTGAGDPAISTLVSSVFASVAGPVFDAGLRKAQVDARKAGLEELSANYAGAFLEAIREVESSLLTEQNQERTVHLLEDQLEIARMLLRETRNRYSQGLTDYLPVLGAVATMQNLERNVLVEKREWLSSRVNVHRALGGPISVDLPYEEGDLL